MLKMKNALDGINDRWNNAEEKTSKIKDVAIETIQNNHREKRQLLKWTEHH